MSLWMEGGAVCENPYTKERGLSLKNWKVGAQFRRNCKISHCSAVWYMFVLKRIKIKMTFTLYLCRCLFASKSITRFLQHMFGKLVRRFYVDISVVSLVRSVFFVYDGLLPHDMQPMYQRRSRWQRLRWFCDKMRNRLQVLAANLGRREGRDGVGGGGVKLLVLIFSLVPHESNMLTEY